MLSIPLWKEVSHMAVRVRFVRPEDAEALAGIYAPYVRQTAVTFEYEPPSPEEFRRRIIGIRQRYPYLAAEEDGELLGYCYASSFKGRAAYDWAAETSIYIRMDQHRRGLGRWLYAVLEELLRAQGILDMLASIALPESEDEYLTLDSVRFHSALGFREIARFPNIGSKFGRWYHMVWMDKVLGEHSPDPRSVLPVSALGYCDNTLF